MDTQSPLSTELRHFIPFRTQDIIAMCASQLPAEQTESFSLFCQSINSYFHRQFYPLVENLKDSYATIDPDRDTRLLPSSLKYSTDSTFVDGLKHLLEKANYQALDKSDLENALQESSVFKLRLYINFDDFEEILLYCRGESLKTEDIPQWFGLRSKSVTFINYERVMLYVRTKHSLHQTNHSANKKHPSADDASTDSTLLKLFRNVPKADLEMLLPNTELHMRLIDKLLIGIPAIISGTVVLATKLGASLVLLGSLLGFWLGLHSEPVELNKTNAMILGAGIAALGGYIWKQFSSFKNRKLRFMKTLTENLYFKNLDNNAGVFHRIADDAIEEESKEAILAYFHLLQHGSMNKETLDNTIEQWFKEQWQCNIDFEVNDALNKLQSAKLITETDNNFTPISLDKAIQQLQRASTPV